MDCGRDSLSLFMDAMDRIECDVLVIGAGVVGLAIAATLSEQHSVVVLEKHSKFGQETSSRNSEVVHSGIYYGAGSQKTELCIRGRHLLYDYCESRGVAYLKTGKIVVATQPSEAEYLQKLAAHCRALDVPCEEISGERVAEWEPLVRAESGLWLPETGIVDSHQLMAALEREFESRGGVLAYRNRVTHLARAASGFEAQVDGTDGGFLVSAGVVVNAAGLGAAAISNAALGVEHYEHRYCRGRYFTLPAKYRGKFQRLIYPVPPKDGLGIHVTVDLDGCSRLGPDVDWSSALTYDQVETLYDCDWEGLRVPFAAAVQRYCPGVDADELQPALIGVRPKLFVDGVARPDFRIENHQGFIHCLGIESPGLTSSLAIAQKVRSLMTSSDS